MWFPSLSTAGVLAIFSHMAFAVSKSEGGIDDAATKGRLLAFLEGFCRPLASCQSWDIRLRICSEGLDFMPEEGFVSPVPILRLECTGVMVRIAPLLAAQLEAFPGGERMLSLMEGRQDPCLMEFVKVVVMTGRRAFWLFGQVVWEVARALSAQILPSIESRTEADALAVVHPDNTTYLPGFVGNARH